MTISRLTYGILDIFISSKERSELTDDRLITQTAIQDIGLSVINSENRHADSDPMELANINEAMACDIYLVILGKCYSLATIKEFETARANNKDVLMFLRNVQQRDEELEEFIKRIRDPKTGIVYQTYSNVIELKSEVKISIIKLLSKRYREQQKYRNSLERVKVDGVSTSNKPEQIDIPSKLRDINFNISEKFIKRITLESIKISKMKFNTYKVDVKVHGTSTKAFLDLLIIDEFGKHLWYPDKETWDPIMQIGKMKLENSYKETAWIFGYPNDLQKAIGIFVLVFEDEEGNDQNQRKFVTAKEYDAMDIH